MNRKAYWSNGGKGTGIAPADKRQPITAEKIAQADAALAAAAQRIRNNKSGE
jgi:hypothetical protein